jgi:hypothetical protein
MLPNHYEVEEVSRMRRDEAMQRVRLDRLSQTSDQQHRQQANGQASQSEWGAGVFGQLRRRLSAWFKRDNRLPTRSFTE